MIIMDINIKQTSERAIKNVQYSCFYHIGYVVM
jgi:hypothetical protein